MNRQAPIHIACWAEARTSAGNPLSVGFDQATQAIHEAISTARTNAQLADQRAARAVLSIAGAANRDMAERFIAWARTIGLADRIAIVSDVLPILAAGTPDCCGVALISGTGSSAFGRAADGRAKRCGGWGYLLGDEGSGYAIGRAALQLALRSFGRRHCRSRAWPRPFSARLGVKSVTELTRAIYGNANPRQAIAALAPLVSTAADQGDTDACRILDDAAAISPNLAARTARSRRPRRHRLSPGHCRRRAHKLQTPAGANCQPSSPSSISIAKSTSSANPSQAASASPIPNSPARS